MKRLWTRSAISDLQKIRSYIEQDNPEAASRIGKKIVELVDQLVDFPKSGRVGRVKGTRELIVSGTPYFIPYRVKDRQIQLLRVLHGRQEYP